MGLEKGGSLLQLGIWCTEYAKGSREEKLGHGIGYPFGLETAAICLSCTVGRDGLVRDGRHTEIVLTQRR
jgi:hypothetical protein